LPSSTGAATAIAQYLENLENLDLVEIVRSRGKISKKKENDAYRELEKRIKPNILYIVNQFYISGCTKDDIYQEALFALRYKAIPDYNKDRGRFGPYPFYKFAALCIRRHLSTMLKSSFQNKKKALNTSISLEQDRKPSADEVLSLSNILPITEGTILDKIEDKEYYGGLLRDLFKVLSKFEKKVFLLYVQKYSYEQMMKILNKNYRAQKLKKRVNIKSIDNALSRIKDKGKIIFERCSLKEKEDEDEGENIRRR
jgi:DNA-directed RNA polymerase specialized sigma24 family protein